MTISKYKQKPIARKRNWELSLEKSQNGVALFNEQETWEFVLWGYFL